MTVRLLIGIVLGMSVGALMGYFGQCSSGACPLTANPLRGAIYGGVMGALFTLSIGGSATRSRDTIDNPSIDDSKGDGTYHAEKSMQDSGIVHVNSAEEFERYVVNAPLPCLADFYSDRCGPCQMLVPTIKKLAKKYQDRAVICKVSMDSAPGLARPHRISGVPAVLFFDAGKEVHRLVGYREQADYEKALDNMIENRNRSAKEIADANL